MGRKSKDLDKKLILIGQALIQEKGVSAISMREVAKLANVNLGMLSYYFSGKEDFILKCLNELYIPFINDLESINNLENNRENYEIFLFKLALFSRDNRQMILSIIKDSLSNESAITNFIKLNFAKHFSIMKERTALFLNINEEDSSRKNKALQLVVSLIGFPNLMVAFAENIEISTNIETDELIRLRVTKAIDIIKNFN